MGEEAMKMNAAKKVAEEAKLAKIRYEKEELQKTIDKVTRANNRKKGEIEEARDSAIALLTDLRQGAIEETQRKITAAKLRRDRWALQGLKDKAHEAQLNMEDSAAEYHDLAERAEDANAQYTKDKSIVRTERTRVMKLKEQAHADQRHYDVSMKVKQLADTRYQDANDDVHSLKGAAKQKEATLKQKRRDWEDEQEAESNLVKSIGEEESSGPLMKLTSSA